MPTLLLLPLLGCKIIEAPEDFDALTAYLYEHMPSDVDVLAAGMQNMDAWLTLNHAELEQGYLVKNLTLAAIHSAVPGYEEEVALVGVAMSRDYDFDVTAFAHHSYWDDPDNPAGTTTWLEDGDCFIAQECQTMSFEKEDSTAMPLGVTVDTTYRSEARWSPTDPGQAMVQRRYLTGPADVSVSWIHLIQEFGLDVSIPLEGGGTRRTSGSWVAVRLGDLPTPEDLLIQLGLGELEDSLERLQAALEEEVGEQ
jgi:hypothetical protein